MTIRIDLSARAVEDMVASSAYYRGEGGAPLGERFEAGVIECLEQVRLAPESGALYRSNRADVGELRWVRVVGFERHLVFYRVGLEPVEVVRILHGARYLDALLDDQS